MKTEKWEGNQLSEYLDTIEMNVYRWKLKWRRHSVFIIANWKRN